MRLNRSLCVASCLLAGIALGATEANRSPKLAVTAGVDYTSQYYFRGIPQENQGWIVQPYATVGLTMPEPIGPFANPTIAIGSWNSIHGGPTGQGNDPSNWYESDAIASLSATIAERTTLTFAYTAYTSPNGSFNTIQELSLGVSYDDTSEKHPFAWHPRALIAVEIDDQADAGNSQFDSTDTSRGVYLELGITPDFPLTDQADAWKLAIPVTVGFSLHDYYETSDGDDRTFGYCDVGTELVVPLTFMKVGSWTLRGGPHIMWMGDNNTRNGESVTGGNQDIQFYGRIGISVSF